MTTSTSNAPAAPPRPPDRATDDAGGGAQDDAGAAAAVAEAPPPTTLAGRAVVALLVAALVISTLAFGTVHPWAMGLFAAGAALCALLWAADAWGARALRLSRSPMQLALAGLFAVGLVQLLPLGDHAAAGLAVEPARSLSLDPYSTRMALVQIASLLVYFAAALVFINSPARLRTVVRALIIFGAGLALFGLLQFFLNPTQIYWIRQPQFAVPFGPFINRHHFAAYMELMIGLPAGLLLSGAVKKDLIPLYAFAAVIMSVSLVATASRGGIMSLGAEIFFLVVVAALARGRGRSGGESRGGALARAGLHLAVAGVLLAGVLLYAGQELMSRTVSTFLSDNVTTNRVFFWQGAKKIIGEHPWLGAGLGSFGVAFTRHDPLNGVARLEQAHNDYLQVFADAGVVGGLLGLVFLVSLYRGGFARLSSRDAYRRGVAVGALGGCTGILVHSFVDFPLHITAAALLFLLLAALATLDGRVEEAEKTKRRRRRRTGHGHGVEGAPARAELEEHVAA
jgi:O-antigen ligase